MSISTLGEAETAGWKVFVTCDGSGCNVREALDLRALLWTRGRAFPLEALSERLRCPMCGSRSVRVTFSLPTSPKPVEQSDQPRYLVETMDVRGEVVEVVGHVARFDAGERLFRRTVMRKPGASIVFRDGSRVIRTWPSRKT